MVTLTADGLCKAFPGVGPVLAGASLRLEPGTVTELAGPGRTTLVRCLAGACRPDTGSVTLAMGAERVVLGEVDARTVAWLRRDHLVLVEGSLLVPPRETAAEAVRHPAAGRLLADLGLDAFADTPVGLLPAPTRRALDIGRSLLRPPHVLLLDEPLSGLSARAADHLRTLVAAARDAGTAVLAAVGADDDLAGDRRLHLDKGVLL